MSLYLIAAIMILGALVLSQLRLRDPYQSAMRDGAALGAAIMGLIALMIEVILSGYEAAP